MEFTKLIKRRGAKKAKLIPLSVTLPAELFEWFTWVCAKEKRPKSHVIADMLIAARAEYEKKNPPEKIKKVSRNPDETGEMEVE